MPLKENLFIFAKKYWYIVFIFAVILIIVTAGICIPLFFWFNRWINRKKSYNIDEEAKEKIDEMINTINDDIDDNNPIKLIIEKLIKKNDSKINNAIGIYLNRNDITNFYTKSQEEFLNIFKIYLKNDEIEKLNIIITNNLRDYSVKINKIDYKTTDKNKYMTMLYILCIYKYYITILNDSVTYVIDNYRNFIKKLIGYYIIKEFQTFNQFDEEYRFNGIFSYNYMNRTIILYTNLPIYLNNIDTIIKNLPKH